MRHSILGASVLALTVACVQPASAQETTSSVRGRVSDQAGQPIADAAVTIVHIPSGTQVSQSTDATGNFSASGLRAGGPFRVTVEAPSYDSKAVEGIQTAAGTTLTLNVTLAAAAGQDIVVTAARNRNGLALAGQTSLNADAIQGIASVNRDLRDLLRRDPLTSLDPNPRGRAISIGGASPRGNRFTIDGVAIGDDFGLNAGGLPSARGIVSLDAIDQLNVKAVPIDISEGDLQGGSVNIILKSGGNKFHGGLFGIYGDDDLQGTKTYDNVRSNGAVVPAASGRLTPVPKFRDFGGNFSGPIIKDKLFFAVAYEQLEESQVSARGLAGEGASTEIPFVTRTNVDQVRGILNSRYGFDPLDIAKTLPEKDKKASAKLDWNISDRQRLALTYIHHENEVPRDVGFSESGSDPSVGLQSNFYLLGEKTNAYAAQLNSNWSDNFSTEFRVTRRDYERRQDPYGGTDFPEFEVCLDGVSRGSGLNCLAPTGTSPNGRVLLGPDQYRQSNYLSLQNTGVSWSGQYSGSGHVIKVLAEGQRVKINNLFVPATRGKYYFDSIADLAAGRANQLTYANALSGDPSDAAARFNYMSYTFGLQDSWSVSPDITVTAGLRYDWIDAERPMLNQRFLATYGFTNAAMPTGGVLQPRLGVTWDVKPNLRVSAGGGLFGGGTPDVWFSNSFANDGVRQNNLLFQRTATGFVDATQSGAAANIAPGLGSAALDNVSGTGVPSLVDRYLSGTGAPAAASVAALDPNLKLASTWKANVALTWSGDLPFGPNWIADDWEFNLSALASEVQNGFVATDLRTSQIGTLPDGRPRYANAGGSNWDIVLRNTSQGSSRVVGLGVGKRIGGLSLGANYIYSDVKDVGSFTGYTPTELLGVTTADPNRGTLGRSSFETRHNGKVQIGYRADLFGDNEFRIDLFGEFRSGRPFSYTFTDASNGRSQVFGTVGGNGRHLFYVPDFDQAAIINAAGRPQVGVVEFADQATLNAIRATVDGSKLRNHYGAIASRNIGTSPGYSKLDLHISQEIPFFFGKAKIFTDVENVLNLLNRNWNTYKVFSDSVSVANVSCVATAQSTCGRYLYSNPSTQTATTYQSASLWQMRVGMRFDF
ncbi:carboxypeptidase regulatory-like domain-containing protein [Sphingomonas sp. PB2P12]|uniref:TonB-dependent receptor n=1 Tax=Sphingomonas sandaracina TaxID=3096157 RepID=UPI002FCC0DBF